ncbi:lytic polysaccharide monooxygenase [Pseudoalteromonas aurantia]|uniref:Lytic polysaccharide monooxygenase n=2 Tax=Pseudoalteromonas aurantia TaxID=43654 RepID=A0A873P577_9GAMM|nr:lytic polysaccharide monooxygenase [Pseudoalteromonas aurantia]MBE0370733.1 chitin-binding protein [Pseudoalteromonas aurantia 208]QPA18449.1 lytic polysaccharide monooxygenase [Pseudoalteromonas aurantia]
MKTLDKNISRLGSSIGAIALTIVSQTVMAHGFMEIPKARQAICQAQGGYWWPDDGSSIPNLACRAAFLESGYVQFIQEHEFAVNTPDYNNQAAVEQNIPNSTLCAAGSNEKRGMNLPSSHWQKTEVTPNAQNELAVRFRATTPHNPSFWKFYISKPTFDPSVDTLGWQDLELVTEVGNVDFVKDPDGKRFYEMKVAIPQDRVGDAILYTRWQRIDVVGEGFYNCSDITIVRDTGPVNWTSAGYYLKQGQSAKVTDTVWTRIFDGTGKEIVSKSLKVTADNELNWQQKLADMLNLDHANIVQVGVRQASGDITFDAQNLLSNEVFVSHSEHTYNLTVQVQAPNTAPKIHKPEPFILDESATAQLHVHAFDDEQQALTYQWQVPSPLTFTGSGATIDVTASQVDVDTDFSILVTVSDGELSTSATVPVTVKNTTAPQFPKWRVDGTYVGGDKVSHNGNNYEAKWWTLGEEPGSAQVWKKL